MWRAFGAAAFMQAEAGHQAVPRTSGQPGQRHGPWPALTSAVWGVMGDCEWPMGARGAAPGSEPEVLLCGKPAKDRTPAGRAEGTIGASRCVLNIYQLATYRLQRSQGSQAST